MTLPSCRSCGTPALDLVLDLGLQPLANSLLRDAGLGLDMEPLWPLRLAICPTCHLLQLTDTVPPEDLFSDYIYFSSFSTHMLAHAAATADQHIREFAIDEKSFVVEIASNDGYLLKHFVDRNIPALGVEPAHNVADVARSKGIQTLEAFFGEETAKGIVHRYRPANLVLGNNVFAHVPEPNDFVAGLATLLAADGVAALEFPWALEMVRNLEFDTVYHEHVFYFYLTALVPLFGRHGLDIFRVDRLPIHGGSLRLYVCRQQSQPIGPSVSALLAEERAARIDSAETYAAFRIHVQELREQLRRLLGGLKADGYSIAAYGASAKGSTLLNYCDLGVESIDFIVDRSPYKQTCFSPGKRIPILPSEALLERQPDYTLLLTWNFADEIVEQQAEYRRRGGRFIMPLPRPRVLS